MNDENTLYTNNHFFDLLYSKLSETNEIVQQTDSNNGEIVDAVQGVGVGVGVDVSDNYNTQQHTSPFSDTFKECLITYTRLEAKHITLECGHTFNYKPIYQEVVNQKRNGSKYEIEKLALNQLKCPFCRNIQSFLLPPRDGFDNITGVNHPAKYCLYPSKCEYMFLNGTRKGSLCTSPCLDNYCDKHDKMIKRRLDKKNLKIQASNANSKDGGDGVGCNGHGVTGCEYVIKYGKRKGSMCGNTYKDTYCDDNNDIKHYCVRHFAIVKKQNMKTI